MNYIAIQRKIDYGRGKAAQRLGSPFNVYRLNGSSTGNIIHPGNLIAQNVSVRAKVAYGAGVRESLETEAQKGIQWWQIVADLTNFLVGDIFVSTDPIFGQGSTSVNFSTSDFLGFALAEHAPIKKALGGRLNTTIEIWRPPVGTDNQGRFDKTGKKDGTPVILSGGVFSLGANNATPSQIPAGLMASGRSYDGPQFSNVPAQQRRSSWELYVPALPGFNINEGDRIYAADGARYIVTVPYTQNVGTSGGQWMIEREAAAP